MIKRLHVRVSVDDLAQSIRLYSTLFAAGPTVVKDDYAKWMVDDPWVNFAISEGGVPDPAAVEGTEADKKRAFPYAFQALETRIKLITSLRLDVLDRLAIKRKVDEIGHLRVVISEEPTS
jgi:hypothetical protein